MKKFFGSVLVCVFFLAAFSPAVFADSSPSRWVVIPEAVWAEASGGGTWVTALQVTAKVSGTPIHIQFFDVNGMRTTLNVVTSTANHQTFRWTNILQTMDAIDLNYNFYGKVGSLLVYTSEDAQLIWAQAMTTNGNYGKTFPHFVWQNTANSAHVGRNMVIPGIQNSSTYRTFAGIWNTSGAEMTVRFYVMNPIGFYYLGAYFEKTILNGRFVSFNPFAEAGLTAAYTNSWLYIVPQSGAGTVRGVFCYGSIANNYTNDTYALIATPFQ